MRHNINTKVARCSFFLELQNWRNQLKNGIFLEIGGPHAGRVSAATKGRNMVLKPLKKTPFRAHLEGAEPRALPERKKNAPKRLTKSPAK